MSTHPTPVGRTSSAAELAADRKRRLEALRDRLEGAVADSGHRELAALAGRYQSVLAELAALPDATEGDGVDDLAARRTRRGRPGRRTDTPASESSG